MKRALSDDKRGEEGEPHGELGPPGWGRWQAVADGEIVVSAV